MIMIDSNIWAYYLDADAPEHRSVAPAVRRSIREGVLINTVVVIEVAHFLIKNLGPVLGREKLDVFLGFPMQVDELTLNLAREATDELSKYSHLGVGGRDATLLASMRRRGVTKLMTHDEALKRVPSIEIFDPIESKHRR
jgi:predicted nucleic acid-binding protein